MNVPSGYTALDLIGFTDRGDYSPSANYVKNDLVHSGGRVWLCLVDDTTNITPAVGANWKIWIDEAAYLSGLADTTITSPIDGQVLRYDIATNKWVNASVDSSPTQNSTNLVQSGGVFTQLANKANTSDLATVATTGAYSDLSGKPNLAAVATSGSYNDLSNKPTLGTAAAKDSTNAVTQNSTDLVESGAVYTEIDTVKQALTTLAEPLKKTVTLASGYSTQTFTNQTGVTGDMEVVRSYIQYPRHVMTEIIVNTSSSNGGQIVVNATISKATQLTLYLAVPRTA